MAEIARRVRALREGDDAAKAEAARALRSLAWRDDANQVAIAEAGGIPPLALVELARRGSVTVDNRSAVRGAGVPVKRKAALVVAQLLRDYVPGFKSVPRDIKGLIGTYL
ncbi:hypothetical protein JL720_5885 [Aureococcus anophagefferens]|nr:hypothetical protein JL720_5885 [Aureococcus anophagefferens]